MKVNLLKLQNTPIFTQLQIEEALLRAGTDNYCLINEGSTEAIVMGISGKPEQLVHPDFFSSNIPLIKRFSGGGTVFVDANTYFITLIFNNQNLPQYPREILKWTETLLKPVFSPLDFQLKENDYTLGDHKFGGNAQAICKDRWLHHSSLLWDYDPLKMNLLLMPHKRPAYRNDRPHQDFLCTLKPHFSKEEITKRLISRLAAQFTLKEISLDDIAHTLSAPHRKGTQCFNL